MPRGPAARAVGQRRERRRGPAARAAKGSGGVGHAEEAAASAKTEEPAARQAEEASACQAMGQGRGAKVYLAWMAEEMSVAAREAGEGGQRRGRPRGPAAQPGGQRRERRRGPAARAATGFGGVGHAEEAAASAKTEEPPAGQAEEASACQAAGQGRGAKVYLAWMAEEMSVAAREARSLMDRGSVHTSYR
ncbi:uncharacterized protein LOC133910593 [Phragmites australis]|uniref:uncharacterized protein LOC133910593 n=1 Tax=Phragmites australis TaxID=29695 RepID=UPI002D798BA6|nr:uncharacterized protein LOC133910593 [Phragmites australis]